MLLQDENSTMHIGNVLKDNNILYVAKSQTRPALIRAINAWLSNYCSKSDVDIDFQQLPPLDDWSKSKESTKGPGNWYIKFPNESFLIIIQYE